MITVKDSLKAAELLRSEDITNTIDEALAKLKSSDEFVALFKKDHDTRFGLATCVGVIGRGQVFIPLTFLH